MIKGMIKTGLFLFVVAALAGILLAFTESQTAPVIRENQIKAEENAQKEVLPSDAFSDEFTKEIDNKKISYRVGFTTDGKVTGAVFKVSPKGFGGDIKTIVGINKDGRVVNYKILSLSETPGLGNKLTSEKFSSDFKNLLANNSSPNFKVKKDGGDVDAITAATISSRAFCTGINQALDSFKLVKEDVLSAKFTQKAEEAPITGGVK